jgi:hypothetical protein
LVFGISLAGCAGQPAPPSNLSNLVLIVKAEPKSGWHDPRNDSSYAGLRPGESKAFETIDYSALDDIVVWIEPIHGGVESPPTSRISVDASHPSDKLTACGVREGWMIRNSGSIAASLFVRSESGKVYAVGSVPAGGSSFFLPRETGLNELMSDASDQPLERIYVAPVRWEPEKNVRIAKAGDRLTFSNLMPGQVIVGAWHPRLPGSSLQFELDPGKTTTKTMTIGVNSLPKVP